MEMQIRWRKLQTNSADNSSDPVALDRRKDLSKTIREIFQHCTIKFFSAVCRYAITKIEIKKTSC